LPALGGERTDLLVRRRTEIGWVLTDDQVLGHETPPFAIVAETGP